MESTATKRLLTRDDIMPLSDYVKVRAERRRQVSEIKKRRRVEVGPFTTFYFENWTTMWHQVHEMLYIEKGGEQQIADELRAYNPLIPQGSDLVATVMIEIDDPVRRKAVLERLSGIETRMFIQVGGETVRGIPEAERENTRESDGKASSIQFMHFPFTAAQKDAFRRPGAQVVLGFDHPNYSHMAVMPDAVREALAADFD